MQCVEFENRLNEVLDERGRPDMDILLASHAHHCEACQVLLARYELICETAGNLRAPKLPAGFAQRVVGEYVRQYPANRGSGPRATRLSWAVPLFALAAVLLVAVLPLLNSNRSARPTTEARLPGEARLPSESRPAATNGSALAIGKLKPGHKRGSVAPSPVMPSSPVVAVESLDPAAEHYAGLAKETGHSLAAAVLYLPGVGGSLAGSDTGGSDTVGSSFAFEQPLWVGQVSDGLRPVTASMSDALHVLMRAFPSSESSTRDGGAS